MNLFRTWVELVNFLIVIGLCALGIYACAPIPI